MVHFLQDIVPLVLWGFYCKTDLVTLNSMELTYIIYDLNKLMDKIEKMICKIQEKDFNEPKYI